MSQDDEDDDLAPRPSMVAAAAQAVMVQTVRRFAPYTETSVPTFGGDSTPFDVLGAFNLRGAEVGTAPPTPAVLTRPGDTDTGNIKPCLSTTGGCREHEADPADGDPQSYGECDHHVGANDYERQGEDWC